jgi:hypothetical protein
VVSAPPFALSTRRIRESNVAAPEENCMLVRLTVKLAEVLDGIDLSHCAEGDVIEIADRQGDVLIAEGWAERVSAEERVSCVPIAHHDVALTSRR